MASNKPKADTISDELCAAVDDEAAKIAEREAGNLANAKQAINEARPAHSRTNSPPTPAAAGVPTSFGTAPSLAVAMNQRLAGHAVAVAAANVKNVARSSELAAQVAPRIRIAEPKKGQ